MWFWKKKGVNVCAHVYVNIKSRLKVIELKDRYKNVFI